MKYLVVVLFDVGSDVFYNSSHYVETNDDPKAIAIDLAVKEINEEYGDEDFRFTDGNVVDILVYEKSFIDKGFEEQLQKV